MRVCAFFLMTILLVLFSTACDLAASLTNRPEPVPSFANDVEAVDYITARANLVVNKGQRLTVLAMAAGQGACLTKMANLGADVQELEQAFFATPEGADYRQTILIARPDNTRDALSQYVQRQGAGALAAHINKQISYMDAAIRACD